MGSSLVRWIIAGVLLAIFVALIVSEELGDTAPDGVLANGTVPVGPATMFDPSSVPPPMGQPQPPPDGDRERKPELETACAPITDRLMERFGEEWLKELGEKLWTTHTDQDVVKLCRELASLSEADQLARLTQLTGLQPPQ